MFTEKDKIRDFASSYSESCETSSLIKLHLMKQKLILAIKSFPSFPLKKKEKHCSS